MNYRKEPNNYIGKAKAIDQFMMSSLSGQELRDYIIFKITNAKRGISLRQKYQAMVAYSNENITLREDNVRKGLASRLSDEKAYVRAGFRIVTAKELCSVLD